MVDSRAIQARTQDLRSVEGGDRPSSAHCTGRSVALSGVTESPAEGRVYPVIGLSVSPFKRRTHHEIGKRLWTLVTGARSRSPLPHLYAQRKCSVAYAD